MVDAYAISGCGKCRMKAETRREYLDRLPTHFMWNTLQPFLFIGLAIPVLVLAAVRNKIFFFSDNDAMSTLCYWLGFAWPVTLRNFSDIYSLGYPIEANAYVLLVLLMELYAASLLFWSIVRFARMREKILPPTAFDAAMVVGVLLFYLLPPRIVHVRAEFAGFSLSSLSLFVIDQYGFWIFKCYVLLVCMLVVAPICIACPLKLVEMKLKKSRMARR